MKKAKLLITIVYTVLFTFLFQPIVYMAGIKDLVISPKTEFQLALSTPTDLTYQILPNNVVRLNWKCSTPDVSGFYIKIMNFDTMQEYKANAYYAKTSHSYDDREHKTFNTTYRYEVISYRKNSDGKIEESSDSKAIFVEMPYISNPGEPTNFRATEVADNKVKLEWELKENTANEFWLECISSNDFKDMYDVDGDVFSHTFEGLKSNTEYEFKICTSTICYPHSNYVAIKVTTKPSQYDSPTISLTPTLAPTETITPTPTIIVVLTPTNGTTPTETLTPTIALETLTPTPTAQITLTPTPSARITLTPTPTQIPTLPILHPDDKGLNNRKIEEIHFCIGSNKYKIDNQEDTMDVSPIISEGRTLLPVRYIAVPLNATIEWTSDEQKVTIKHNTKTIELWINNNIAKVDGMDTPIDTINSNVSPIIVPPGRTMLPLRFIAENLDCKVSWNAETQEILISNKYFKSE